MAINYISLFTGVGGFDLGFDRASMNCVLQVEQDNQALEVLRKHWPDVPKMTDVRDVTRESIIGPVDLICGGFPCQDVSVAGKRKGLAGARSGLWEEFHRILRELTPRWAVIENVPGLFSSNKGRDFAEILRGLDELGYHVAWRVLDSQYFGVPQRRRRVYLVASLGDGGCAEILFESTRLLRDPSEGRAKGKGSAGELEESFNADSAADRVGSTGNMLIPETVGACQARDYKGACNQWVGDNKFVVDTGNIIPNCKTEGDVVYHENEEVPTIQREDEGKALVSATVTAKWSRGSGGPSGDECQNLTYSTPALGDVREYDIASTMQAKSGSAGETQNPAYVQQGGVRRLTPTECCRLQGFPDDWNDFQSDTQRYKQMGNAVTVNVAEWIGERIARRGAK